MLVTSLLAVLALSCNLASSSPVLTSQHSTSSLAPTNARPAEVVEVEAVQRALEEAEVTVPKVWLASYFLQQSATVMKAREEHATYL